MTTDRDFDRIALAWLADGPEELSVGVLDAVVDEIHVTRQRHGLRLPWRFPSMTTPVRVAAAAAIGVLAIGGAFYAFGTAGSGVGAPGPTPPPTVSPTPRPSPAALHEGALAAGTYVTTPFDDDGTGGSLGVCFGQTGCTEDPADDTVRISFTIPEGWEGRPRHAVRSEDGTWLVFERGASLYAEPCGALPPPNIPVGPTVDDFANAIADHPKLDVTAPVDVTLAGYRGKYADLRVPDDITACPDAYWPWGSWWYGLGPGQRWHLWILDIDGVRVVIRSMDDRDGTAQHQADLRAVVDSIQIQP